MVDDQRAVRFDREYSLGRIGFCGIESQRDSGQNCWRRGCSGGRFGRDPLGRGGSESLWKSGQGFWVGGKGGKLNRGLFFVESDFQKAIEDGVKPGHLSELIDRFVARKSNEELLLAKVQAMVFDIE